MYIPYVTAMIMQFNYREEQRGTKMLSEKKKQRARVRNYIVLLALTFLVFASFPMPSLFHALPNCR